MGSEEGFLIILNFKINSPGVDPRFLLKEFGICNIYLTTIFIILIEFCLFVY